MPRKKKIKDPPVVLSFAGEKGGIGKTLCSGNVSAGLVKKGYSVTLIDLDPQGNLTTWFTGKNSFDKSIWHFMTGDKSEEMFYSPNGSEKFSLIVSNREMAEVPMKMAQKPQSVFYLKKAVKNLSTDFVVIDTPPNLGQLSVSALVASDYVFLPITPEFFSLYGLSNILNTIEDIQETANPNLKIGGIIINKFDQRRKLNKTVLADMRESFPDLVCDTVIRENVNLSEATGEQEAIFSHSPRSYGAQDFKKLVNEIVKGV